MESRFDLARIALPFLHIALRFDGGRGGGGGGRGRGGTLGFCFLGGLHRTRIMRSRLLLSKNALDRSLLLPPPSLYLREAGEEKSARRVATFVERRTDEGLGRLPRSVPTVNAFIFSFLHIHPYYKRYLYYIFSVDKRKRFLFSYITLIEVTNFRRHPSNQRKRVLCYIAHTPSYYKYSCRYPK